MFLINARLSERSARGYERIRALARPVMQEISWVAAQAEADAERFRRIGVAPERVEVTGSIKFDVDITPGVRAAAEGLRSRLSERPVWIAGSTHAGEDGQLLEVQRRLLEQYPDALLILVPRHPERFDSVAREVAAAGLSLARRSQGDDPVSAQVYLGDTMGELMMLYGAADVAFVGGSLVQRGGHNPLEPAAWGIPVCSGPHVFNFETIYRHLQDSDGVRLLAKTDDIATWLAALFSDPQQRERAGQRALAVVEKNRGALDRVVDGVMARV